MGDLGRFPNQIKQQSDPKEACLFEKDIESNDYKAMNQVYLFSGSSPSSCTLFNPNLFMDHDLEENFINEPKDKRSTH